LTSSQSVVNGAKDIVLASWKKGSPHELVLEGKVPGITNQNFIGLANEAKKGCPISRALSALEITLDAKLV
jgi:organic hydroperoxide reductase OsmC/OhrA